MVAALGTQGRVSPSTTESPSASPAACPAFSSACAIGFVAGFLAPLTVSIVSASSFLLYSMVTTSRHRWFSPPPSLTAVYLQALSACP